MIGFIGNVLIWTAFAASLAALVGYGWSAQSKSDTLYRFSNYLFALKGLLVIAASGLLIHLIVTHQFQYYYVFNYTSKDLQLKYLVSAFYGGQEGSFLLWILFSAFVGVILMRCTREPYRKPVLFIITLNQVFLLSMVVGIDFGAFKLGASPFRTLAQEMPNAPFIQQNPDFVPSDGSGLNDLLRSPWMMIHPPVLFLGFSLMTVPYAYAMAALWKKRYQEWVNPALPWTLGSNLCLLFAIFLGGYWAYVTLSFGGYWAWDPVENASFVPWLFGIAGVHTMLIQRKSSTSQKASLIFAILAYIAVVYETFLTRSGILSDSSVHSFVDLGLYNQLLVFMGVIAGLGVGLLLYRYKELPKQEKESPLLSREFMTFSGAMILFLIGLVILLGTSSPVIGKLFVENPTPPEVSFYNEWTMPLAMIAAVLTVLGQYLFWKRYDAESLASALLLPLLITSAVTLTNIIYVNIQNVYYMAYLFTAWFALVGNSFVMVRLARRKPKLIGGATSHIGFAILLLGILGSSAYNSNLLDRETRNYTERREADLREPHGDRHHAHRPPRTAVDAAGDLRERELFRPAEFVDAPLVGLVLDGVGEHRHDVTDPDGLEPRLPPARKRREVRRGEPPL
jgi:cytochrome c-type biogenesis protein CcmF